MERREMPFGYVSEMSAGSFSEPYSFLQAAERAQDISSRLMSNTEYQSAINYFEKQLKNTPVVEGKKGEKRPSDESALEVLSSLYGNNFGSPGYAGARTMTGTVVEKDGTVTDVDGVFGKYLYGPKQYHGRWLADLLNLARQMQERGEISYIKEFDESTGLPVAISSEPNPKYHNAVFYVSPSVKEIGVVVRGIHHSVGEPCAKYDFAILPPDYKDIMLGHRTVSDTNRAKLGMVTGIAGALIYELADKTIRGRISTKQAVKRIASYVSDKKMSRRTFNSALALFSLYLAGCGGEESTNPPPPPPPPAQTFTYSGSILKRIANDGSKIGQGVVRLEGTPGTFTGNIDSAGNFSMTGVKAGFYKRTTSDGASDSVYVPQVESVVQINSNLTGQNYSVIERGANRFGVPFDNNFQTFYEKLAQGTHFIPPTRVIKWGNASGQLPTRVRIVASTIPDDVENQFRDAVVTIVNRDTAAFSGERISTLPVEFGEVAADLEIEKLFHGSPTVADYPLLDDKRIVRARVRYDSQLISDAIRRGADITGNGSHEYFHCWGAADFTDPNFDSVINSQPGRVATQPTVNDKLAAFTYNHPNVHPGNTAPDTNP